MGKKNPARNLIDAGPNYYGLNPRAATSERVERFSPGLKAAFRAAGSKDAKVAGNSEDDNAFEVLPENWIVIELLKAIQTQWNFSPDGKRCGYNYSAVALVIKHQFNKNKALFGQMQICEREILAAWDESSS